MHQLMLLRASFLSFAVIFFIVNVNSMYGKDQKDEAGNVPELGRGARSRKCPGCKIASKDHGWGPAHKDCSGPVNDCFKNDSNFDEETDELQIASSLMRPLKDRAYDDEDDDNYAIEELEKKLQDLSLEEERLKKRNKIDKLRKLVAEKQKAIDELSQCCDDDQAQGDDVLMASGGVSVDGTKYLTTKNLKKLAPEIETPLDMFLGTAGTDEIPQIRHVAFENSASGIGNRNRSCNLGLAQGKASATTMSRNIEYRDAELDEQLIDGIESGNIFDRNLLTADGQANLLLKPKTGGKSSYLRICDFIDSIIPQDSEKPLLENGQTRLLLNSGPKRLRPQDITLPQYVIAAIRILCTLMESKQIRTVAVMRQYLGHIVRIMELAGKHDWKLVLQYDDGFRQLQALYDVPWVYESHHLYAVYLNPSSLTRSSRPYGSNQRYSAGSEFQDIAAFTGDGRTICRNFNNKNKGCVRQDCSYAHVCNKKFNGVACGLNHPRFRHFYSDKSNNPNQQGS